MNKFILPILLFSQITMAEISSDGVGTLFFSNGDRLPGSWEALRLKGEDLSLEFNSPFLQEPSLIKSSAVSSIVWDKERTPPEEFAVIELKNGDELIGSIEEFTPERITLANSYIGKMMIDRQFIATIKFNIRKKTLYHGTYSLKGWKLNTKNAWEVRDNSFFNKIRNAEMIRKIDLPESVHISAVFTGKNYLQNEIKLWASENDQKPVDTISFNLIYNQVSVERNGPSNYRQIMNVNSQELMKFPLKLDLFADRSTDTYLIYVNGRLINVNPANNADEENEEENEPQHPERRKNKRAPVYGDSFMLRFYEPDSSIRDLEISEWDKISPGNYLSVPEEPPKAGEKQVDTQDGSSSVVYLRNGDRLMGKVSQKDRHLRIESKLYQTEIPVELVSNITMPTTARDAAPPASPAGGGDSQEGLPLRLSLVDGTILTARLTGMKDSTLLLNLPYSPGATISLAPVLRILFQLDDEKKDGKKTSRP